MVRNYVWTYFTVFQEVPLAVKTSSISNSKTECLKQLHQETSNSEVERLQFGLGKWTDFKAI